MELSRGEKLDTTADDSVDRMKKKSELENHQQQSSSPAVQHNKAVCLSPNPSMVRRDDKVYGHTTAVMQKHEYTPQRTQLTRDSKKKTRGDSIARDSINSSCAPSQLTCLAG